MFDGDLTTTVSFSTTASIRQMLCFPVPVNSIYAFLSSAAAGTGMHIVVETPTVASPVWTLGDDDWHEVPILTDETIATVLPLQLDGEIELPYISEEDWVEATLDGVTGYWTSIRFVDNASAGITSGATGYQQRMGAPVPSDSKHDIVIAKTQYAGYHWRPAHRQVVNGVMSDIGSHAGNNNSQNTTVLTSDLQGTGDDDDRYFATSGCVTTVTVNGSDDTILLQRCARNNTIIAQVSGVRDSAAYEEGSVAATPFPDRHKVRDCFVDINVVNCGREAARIRGDRNLYDIRVTNPGQWRELGDTNHDRSAVEIESGANMSDAENNRLRIHAVDLTGDMLRALHVDSGSTATNYLESLISVGHSERPFLDDGGALVVMTPKHNFLATTDPGVTNDLDEGYSTGSVWVNTTTPAAFICITAANGAADWNAI